MKKTLIILGLCLLAGYLIFAVFFFEEKPKEQICNRFEVMTDSDSKDNMIDLADIEKQIDAKGLNPYGKPLKSVNTYEIEQVIIQNKMVREADVFITSGGGIRAEVKQRKPILRIISSLGSNYYIDKDGEAVPLSRSFVADLPVATGYITEQFAKNELYEFASYLYQNDFWMNQIEQVVVLPNEDIELIPRIGNHKIILGKIDNYQGKLDKLRTFYDKGLSEVGWNRYSIINLKYDKQVVGTKRKEQ